MTLAQTLSGNDVSENILSPPRLLAYHGGTFLLSRSLKLTDRTHAEMGRVIAGLESRLSESSLSALSNNCNLKCKREKNRLHQKCSSRQRIVLKMKMATLKQDNEKNEVVNQ